MTRYSIGQVVGVYDAQGGLLRVGQVAKVSPSLVTLRDGSEWHPRTGRSPKPTLSGLRMTLLLEGAERALNKRRAVLRVAEMVSMLVEGHCLFTSAEIDRVERYLRSVVGDSPRVRQRLAIAESGALTVSADAQWLREELD